MWRDTPTGRHRSHAPDFFARTATGEDSWWTAGAAADFRAEARAAGLTAAQAQELQSRVDARLTKPLYNWAPVYYVDPC